jgi:phosphodiesterase/alkaline phosphatase D-like protein
VTTGNWNRRRLLQAGALGAVAATAAPASRAAAFVPNGRPVLDSVQSGDAVNASAIIWTKADRGSRMVVNVSDRSDLRHRRTFRGRPCSRRPATSPARFASAPHPCQGRGCQVDIDAHSRAMTVSLRDLDNVELWSTTLTPAGRH